MGRQSQILLSLLLSRCFVWHTSGLHVQKSVELSALGDVTPANISCPRTGLERYNAIRSFAAEHLSSFNAGGTYSQIWIRDFNTFLDEAIEAGAQLAEVRQVLVTFMQVQQIDGGIVDWVIPDKHVEDSRKVVRRRLVTGKNTVATDQETSFIQAVHTYIKRSGNVAFLREVVHDRARQHDSVKRRIERAIDFLMQKRFSPRDQLLFGGTTVDWGDVQAEVTPKINSGVELDKKSHLAVGVYNNAMMALALRDFAATCAMVGDEPCAEKWSEKADVWKQRTRAVLWDEAGKKWRPHVYLTTGSPVTRFFQNGSAFPANFQEDRLHFHGGSGVALLAGLNTREEAKLIYEQMVRNAAAVGEKTTIGLTVYPPYPTGYFPMAPYTYQNGGDWGWFGARTVQGLLHMGLVKEAEEALQPMIDRVCTHKGFWEWHDEHDRPQGSHHFRGHAGVLGEAIRRLLLAKAAKTNESIS